MADNAKAENQPQVLSSSEEVFDFFVQLSEKNDHEQVAAYFAFAWFSFDKFEWIKHERARGQDVSDESIKKWIEQKPVAWYERNYNDAFAVLYEMAEEIIKDDFEIKVKNAVQESILSEVKLNNQNTVNMIDRKTSGWRNFFSNIIAGIVSSFIVAAIALLLYYTTKDDPSLTAIGRRAIEAPPPAPTVPR